MTQAVQVGYNDLMIITKTFFRWLKLSLVVAGLTLLAGCESQPVPTTLPTASPINSRPTTNSTSTNPVGNASPALDATPVPVTENGPSQPAVTAAVPTPLPVGSTTARDGALTALRQMASVQSLRYKVSQVGELSGGGSQDRFEASGNGEWQRPVLHQMLTFKQGGQTRQLEVYADDQQLYQRVVELVVWRKLGGGLAGPFPDPARLNGANFQTNPDNLNGQSVTRYSWTLPGNYLAAPTVLEGLGALSVTGLYQSLAGGQAGAIKANLWVATNGNTVLRYQLDGTLPVGQTSLRYTATYDYSDLNATIQIARPGDLPK